jgi:uncharacterized protein YuzE
MTGEPIEVRYDREVDAAYIRFSHNEVVETVEFEDEKLEDFYADLDAEGVIVGLEVLNYSLYVDNVDDPSRLVEKLPVAHSHAY